jgi:uncharacterized membrane protein
LCCVVLGCLLCCVVLVCRVVLCCVGMSCCVVLGCLLCCVVLSFVGSHLDSRVILHLWNNGNQFQYIYTDSAFGKSLCT